MSAPTRPREPARRSRHTAAVVTAVALTVGLITAAVLVLSVRGRDQANGRAASQPQATRATAIRTEPAMTATTPQVDLSGLRWMEFHGARLPVSSRHGPHHRRDGLASEFARTPTGALLAALHIAVRANAQWGTEIFEPTIKRQVVGSDAETLLDVTRDAYRQKQPRAGVSAGEPLGRAYVSYQAFRWQGYTPQTATVDIVSAGPGPDGGTVRASTRIEVQWRDGAWRVVAPPGGDWGNAAMHVTSVDGYTAFQAPR